MAKEHHTKSKGDLGVLKVQCDLAEKGYTILIPLTEHSTYDLVAEKDGIFKRVQVKYRAAKDGKLSIHMKSSWSDKNGLHVKHLDKSLVDIFAIFCPDTNEVYYFDPSDFSKSVTLRVDTPKNNQVAGVKFANDYCHVP